VVRGIAATIHQNRTPGNGNGNVPGQEHGDARFRDPICACFQEAAFG
jgi:hypothetical protein